MTEAALPHSADCLTEVAALALIEARWLLIGTVWADFTKQLSAPA
jgi:hypothetical protein